MLKRYYADMVTDAAVPPAQAFRFFCNVSDWQDWSSVIHRAKLQLRTCLEKNWLHIK